MILFKTVKWKNFLSTGNIFTEIKLNKTPNTVVVGENGSGKSTMLDALCFALYGKPFRKIKKDQLINTINNREAVVEVEFDTHGKSFRVVRGIKPNVFEIYQDGILLNQTAATKDYQDVLERSVLRMNIKSFAQIVVLGAASFVPFMQLTPANRREVIEDLLDIKIFSTMSSLLKGRHADLREQYVIINKDIESTDALIKLQESARDRETRDDNRIIEDAKELQSAIMTRIADMEKKIVDINAEIDKLNTDINDSDDTKTKLSEIERIESDLEKKIRSTKKSLVFYKDNDTCPTCVQEIDVVFRNKQITDKTATLNTIEQAMTTLAQQLVIITNRLNEISIVQRDIQTKQISIGKFNTQIATDKREIAILEDRIRDVKTKDVGEVETIIEELKKKRIELNIQHEKNIKTREVYDIGSIILRDTGIKARIIKQYIPVINALVNKQLAAMEFFVKFVLNETFEEKILSRHRDDFTYDSFSEGEKMRIDLALLFTWRAIARMKNSASTNLLILDEVFDASLDATGCDEFLKLIQSLENTNVFVISHRGDVLQDKFRASIKFEKHHNFSRISQ